MVYIKTYTIKPDSYIDKFWRDKINIKCLKNVHVILQQWTNTTRPRKVSVPCVVVTS